MQMAAFAITSMLQARRRRILHKRCRTTFQSTFSFVFLGTRNGREENEEIRRFRHRSAEFCGKKNSVIFYLFMFIPGLMASTFEASAWRSREAVKSK